MALVIYLTYTPGVLDHLAPKRLPGLFIAVAVTLLRVYFSAAKLRYLADKEIGWAKCFRIMLTWDFASAVTPSTIGGAPIATYAMTREGMKLGKSSAIILYGVLLDQFYYALAVPILLLAGFYYQVIPPEIGFVGNLTMVLLYTGLLLYAGFLTYGLMINPASIKKIITWIFRWPLLNRLSDKVNAEADNLEEYSYEIRKKPLSFFMKAMFRWRGRSVCGFPGAAYLPNLIYWPRGVCLENHYILHQHWPGYCSSIMVRKPFGRRARFGSKRE